MDLKTHLENSERGELTRIAEIVGTSKGYLSDIANGNRQPSLPLAVKIAQTAGVPIESLVQAEASA